MNADRSLLFALLIAAFGSPLVVADEPPVKARDNAETPPNLPLVVMPGEAHKGPLPPITDAEKALAKALEADVKKLADEIGERNIGGSSLANSTKRSVRAGFFLAKARAKASVAAVPLPLSFAPGQPRKES